MVEAAKIDEKEREARVSGLLHGVEEAIKKGELEEALEKIRKVYKYDIKSMYARAFEERILGLIIERGEKEVKVKYEQQHSKMREEVDREVQIEINRKLKEYHRQWEEETVQREEKERREKELEVLARKASFEDQKIEGEREYAAVKSENRDRIEQWERKMKFEVQNAIDQECVRLEQELAQRLAAMTVTAPQQAAKAHTAPGEPPDSKAQVEAEYSAKLLQTKEHLEREFQGRREAERLMLHEEAIEKIRIENANVQEELQRQFELEKIHLIEREQAKAKDRLIEACRAFIVLMDASMPRDHLDTLLISLRSILGFSDKEYDEIIRSAQLNLYIDALRACWQKGKITNEDRDILAHLCELYHIPPEEYERLTKQVKRQLGLPDENARILTIDDNKAQLMFIDHVLKKTYVNTRTVESVEEAVETIKQELPSLILCDVMMPQKGGFAFYEMIQKGDYGEDLKKTPFVFMSGCSDDYMKKVAADLGVNKYLAKPFSVETLEKTVKEMLMTDVA